MCDEATNLYSLKSSDVIFHHFSVFTFFALVAKIKRKSWKFLKREIKRISPMLGLIVDCETD